MFETDNSKKILHSARAILVKIARIAKMDFMKKSIYTNQLGQQMKFLATEKTKIFSLHNLCSKKTIENGQGENIHNLTTKVALRM